MPNLKSYWMNGSKADDVKVDLTIPIGIEDSREFAIDSVRAIFVCAAKLLSLLISVELITQMQSM